MYIYIYTQIIRVDFDGYDKMLWKLPEVVTTYSF